MIEGHYGALVLAYVAALAGWLLLSRLPWSPWPAGEEVPFEHPWRATGAALLAVLAVVLVGQLYVRSWMLPEGGALGPVSGAVNQILIFSPILILLVVRREPLASAWLPAGRIPVRLGGGVLLALVALVVYTAVRSDADSVFEVLGRILRYDNLDLAVQVLMEDLTIGVLFVRLSASIGKGKAVVLTAVLFAAGHIPAMLAGGNRLHEILLLARDAALGAAVVAVLQRSRDILWFWCVHFVMDMTQFPRITFGI